MTLHLIKLSVGPDTLCDLAARQAERLKILKLKQRKPELIHITRNMPKRAEEILDGGSIYWVIKGWVCARQRLLKLRPMMQNGIPHCGLVYDKKLVRVELRPCRAFQGWRYFDPKDAPPDIIKRNNAEEFPDEMRRELTALGLL
jgi:hypothetical protein